MKSIHAAGNAKHFIAKVFYLAAGAIVLLLFLTESLVASSSGPEPSVTNVRFTAARGQIFIHYDLQGNPGREYKVTVTLRKGNDASYRYVPRALSGDAGIGKFAGSNRKIVWSIGEEFPQGLSGSDFYFVVDAQEVKTASGPGLLTMVGAGVAVAVAAATYFVLSGLHSHAGQVSSLPAPPGRP